MTRPEVLEAIGIALHGDDWRQRLPADLGVTSNTLRQWLLGRRAPPREVWFEALELLNGRQAKIIEAKGAVFRSTSIAAGVDDE